MRASTVLLLCTCLASSAFAQVTQNNPAASVPTYNGPGGAPAAGAAAGRPAAGGAATAMPSMVNGKYVVGYEGRGDYLKNDTAEKLSAGEPTPPGQTPATPAGKAKPAQVSAAAVAAAGAAAAPASAAPDTAAVSQNTHSDSSLHNDPKAVGALSNMLNNMTPNTTNKQSSNTNSGNNGYSTQNTNQNNNNNSSSASNPMILIGGKVQQQH